jgi:hypothetical protein
LDDVEAVVEEVRRRAIDHLTLAPPYGIIGKTGGEDIATVSEKLGFARFIPAYSPAKDWRKN